MERPSCARGSSRVGRGRTRPPGSPGARKGRRGRGPGFPAPQPPPRALPSAPACLGGGSPLRASPSGPAGWRGQARGAGPGTDRAGSETRSRCRPGHRGPDPGGKGPIPPPAPALPPRPPAGAGLGLRRAAPSFSPRGPVPRDPPAPAALVRPGPHLEQSRGRRRRRSPGPGDPSSPPSLPAARGRPLTSHRGSAPAPARGCGGSELAVGRCPCPGAAAGRAGPRGSYRARASLGLRVCDCV